MYSCGYRPVYPCRNFAVLWRYSAVFMTASVRYKCGFSVESADIGIAYSELSVDGDYEPVECLFDVF